jgi:hypothetical protein
MAWLRGLIAKLWRVSNSLRGWISQPSFSMLRGRQELQELLLKTALLNAALVDDVKLVEKGNVPPSGRRTSSWTMTEAGN